jgi:hypothetical protein
VSDGEDRTVEGILLAWALVVMAWAFATIISQLV